ncbi:hypothetical protein D3C81_1753290 [compost metagenome]
MRQGDGANAEGHALQGAGHRAGIADVLADVVAAIDARQHQIRLLGHQVVDRQDDAVGRRAGHGEALVAQLVDPQRLGQGDPPPLGRLLGLGRDDPDFVRQGASDLLKTFKAFRLDAVVIGEKDTHQASFSACGRRWLAQPDG